MDSNLNENKDVSQKLYTLFRRCSHGLIRGHQHGRDIHPSQLRTLMLISKNESITQRELLDSMGIRAASLSQLLGKLDNKGLITREKDSLDKRSVIISITDLGEAVLKERISDQEAKAKKLFSSLSENEQLQLSELLEKLVTSWHEDGSCRGYQGRGFHGKREHHHGHKNWSRHKYNRDF